jgi:hypothetical protein
VTCIGLRVVLPMVAAEVLWRLAGGHPCYPC